MKYFLIFNLIFCLQLAPGKMSGKESGEFLAYRVVKMSCDLKLCQFTLKNSKKNLFMTLSLKDVSFKTGDILRAKNLKFANLPLGVLASMVVQSPKSKILQKLTAVPGQQTQAKSLLRQHHPSSDYLIF